MISQSGHRKIQSPPTICNRTWQKFAQRVTPTHSARRLNTQTNLTFVPSSNFFHYYDFTFPSENETQSMKSYVPDARHLEPLSRTNLHDRLAGTLGILPNHLIQLIRLTNYGLRTQIINDLRFTTFWSTYHIWAKRQTLYHTYWKIIPSAANKEKDSRRVPKPFSLPFVETENATHSRYVQLHPSNGSFREKTNFRRQIKP